MAVEADGFCVTDPATGVRVLDEADEAGTVHGCQDHTPPNKTAGPNR
jgi:hypothetical protein